MAEQQSDKDSDDLRYGDLCPRCNAASGIDPCPHSASTALGGNACPLYRVELPKNYYKPRSAPLPECGRSELADRLDEKIECIDHMGTGSVASGEIEEREWKELARQIRVALSTSGPSQEAVDAANKWLLPLERDFEQRKTGPLVGREFCILAREILRLAGVRSATPPRESFGPYTHPNDDPGHDFEGRRR